MFGSIWKKKTDTSSCRQEKKSVWSKNHWPGKDIAIDLGTENIVIYVKKRGIVVNEPSVIAVDTERNTVVAVGKEAYAMQGRTPGNIAAYHPLQAGVIADYDATAYMLHYFIGKAIGKVRLFKPRVLVCVPSGITNVERRAVMEALVQAGAGKIVIMEETLAAAVGAGIDTARSNGSMVVDLGGGTTDVAVLSLSGIVISASLRLGSRTFDQAVQQYLERYKHITVGCGTAEKLKILIGTALADGKQDTAVVHGRSTETGLPAEADIDSQEIRQALQEPLDCILKTILDMLEKTPPELAADIADHGILLTGGGMLLDGLDRLIVQKTGIAAYLCEAPLLCVAQGAGKTLRHMNDFKNNMEDI